MDGKRAVAYARFSSDMQREESIEAQLRAIEQYADKNGYVLQRVYADRGISGTTDKRPEFQRMMHDAQEGIFDVIIVHKLDRFARNRTISAIYRDELTKHNIRLISVLENLDNSPESIILQSMIEGMNEYFVMNLSREVMKGLKENALSCRHTGGIPCLGYDVDKDTLKYVINEFEAEAVKLIFKRYLEGEGYGSIIDELNAKGYKTKRGYPFGKNSLYEILRNEKYTGVYLYNRLDSKTSSGFNRRKIKPPEEIIRIEGGMPQIISKEIFQKVQEKMNVRRRKAASYTAKQNYLLSGKIVCGECGSSYAGNSRKANHKNPLYISYRCTRKNGSVKCSNKEIQRDFIENEVLRKLAKVVFDESLLPGLVEKYNSFAAEKNHTLNTSISGMEARLKEINQGIDNIVSVLMKTGSLSLTKKLNELEQEKITIEQELGKAKRELSANTLGKAQLKRAFRHARKMLESGTLKNKKAIVEQYVNQVTIYPDRIVVEFNVSEHFQIKEDVLRFS